jgi:hypothetical protein
MNNKNTQDSKSNIDPLMQRVMEKNRKAVEIAKRNLKADPLNQ